MWFALLQHGAFFAEQSQIPITSASCQRRNGGNHNPGQPQNIPLPQLLPVGPATSSLLHREHLLLVLLVKVSTESWPKPERICAKS